MKDQIERIMENHYGPENVIPAAELLILLGFNPEDKNAERKMRLNIERIKRAEDGLPILSIDTPGQNGYYLPRNQDEYGEGVAGYKHHIITRCQVLAQMKKNFARMAEGSGQFRLRI